MDPSLLKTVELFYKDSGWCVRIVSIVEPSGLRRTSIKSLVRRLVVGLLS